MAHLPPIKWAQRADSIFVTIDLPDVTNTDITISGTTISFKGESEKQAFECELELFKEVDAEDKESVYAVRPRDVLFHIMKKERGEEYWPRLLKDKAKSKTHVKTDWGRYVDEDEEKEGFDTGAMGPGAMNFGGAGGAGGMPGMGGMGGMGGGGMPGMGGMGGGMGGMGDLASMMGGMGGAGGAGGAGGMDLASMMSSMGGGAGGGAGGMPDMAALQAQLAQMKASGALGAAAGGAAGDSGAAAADEADSDDSDDDLPDLEADEDAGDERGTD